MNRNIFMRFPGGRQKALTLSYDDGSFQDERLIGLMLKYGLRGTFNLNTGRLREEGSEPVKDDFFGMPTPLEALKRYSEDGLEVATHGVNHPFLDKLPAHMAAAEVLEDRVYLEALFEKPVTGHAYPYGTYSAAVMEVLKSCQISYARTVRSTHSFALPENWLEWNPTCHHNDEKLFALADEFLTKLDTPFDRSPELFYLWGHSFEFDRDGNWHVIEEFAEKMGGRSSVWYCTNSELYGYVRAFEGLIWSVDGRFVRNPSCMDVYLEANRNLYRVQAGGSGLLPVEVLKDEGDAQ